MDITERIEAILEALKTIVMQDTGKDIVTEGSVLNLKVKGDSVSFDLAVVSPDSPSMKELRQVAHQKVSEIEGIGTVDITMVQGERQEQQGPDPWAGRAPIPGVKSIIAVASGKGGVGKSTVAVNLATGLAAQGKKVGLLDADIYGPSVATMMGIPFSERPMIQDDKVLPIDRYEVKTISVAFLLPEENTPLIWRGPMVGKLLKQLLQDDVNWGELDALVVDLPPGTGDAQLTLIQSVPISGSVIVTTPQKLAAIDAIRGIEMFKKLQVPVLGVVENMSHFIAPDGTSYDVFPRDGIQSLEEMYSVPVLASVPIQPSVAEQGDGGFPEVLANPDSAASQEFTKLADGVIKALDI